MASNSSRRYGHTKAYFSQFYGNFERIFKRVRSFCSFVIDFLVLTHIIWCIKHYTVLRNPFWLSNSSTWEKTARHECRVFAQLKGFLCLITKTLLQTYYFGLFASQCVWITFSSVIIMYISFICFSHCIYIYRCIL